MASIDSFPSCVHIRFFFLPSGGRAYVPSPKIWAEPTAVLTNQMWIKRFWDIQAQTLKRSRSFHFVLFVALSCHIRSADSPSEKRGSIEEYQGSIYPTPHCCLITAALEYLFWLFYYCKTDHSNVQWLKTITFLLLIPLQFGQSLTSPHDAPHDQGREDSHPSWLNYMAGKLVLRSSGVSARTEASHGLGYFQE